MVGTIKGLVTCKLHVTHNIKICLAPVNPNLQESLISNLHGLKQE